VHRSRRNCALGPDVVEGDDDESEKDSNDTIADVIEIGIGLNFVSFF